MSTVKNQGSTNNQLIAVDIVAMRGISYFDESLIKIGGILNYGVCVHDSTVDI